MNDPLGEFFFSVYKYWIEFKYLFLCYDKEMICKIKNTEQNHSSGRGASLYTIVRPKVTGSIPGVPHDINFFQNYS